MMTANADQGVFKPNRRRTKRTRPPAGFSLVELLMGLAISAIVITLVIPSYAGSNERAALKYHAELMATAMTGAKRNALLRRQRVYMSTRERQSSWCYGFGGQPLCDCFAEQPAETGNVCELGTSSSATTIDQRSISITPPRQSLVFDPYRGLHRTGRVELRNRLGHRLRIVYSALGRIRVCAPVNNISGYPRCG